MHKKILSITNYHRNVSQNHNENDCYQKEQMLARMWRKRSPPILLGEQKPVKPLWKTPQRFLKKLKLELPYDPLILLLSLYPKKTITQKDPRTPMFTAALFTIAKTWKQPRHLLTDEWINKLWYMHTTENYSAIKRNELGHLYRQGWTQRLSYRVK